MGATPTTWIPSRACRDASLAICLLIGCSQQLGEKSTGESLEDGSPNPIGGLHSVIPTFEGGCGLKENDSLFCWWVDEYRSYDTHFRKIDAGTWEGCGITFDDQLHCWDLFDGEL